ncbi:alpha-1,3-mannosyl-glycoprotein 4-beta-N-acetylglucosaminyltransferase A-like [Dermatophagoides pteronyssinus]|uniref:Alpha-1,3-mannosyl-glycoprotein 4-beta-N-acetylglucosaminyltransferase A-like n=1 Tax=Dermatophagoides pteronyssinus TaxID=6956 RepID=A0A6P6XX82_DERPT|nr:alpha-1,3-mannosyl-glycoprotein 4-beta-N-acetylglucosaminyltransferase A-like [Dermatophagoides pteronyssinus]
MIRKNRILQILLCLFLFTFIFPFLLSLLGNFHNTSNTSTYILNQEKLQLNKYYGQQDSSNERDSIITHAINNLNLTYAKMIAGDSLDRQLAYRFADLNNRVKYAEMIAGERKQEIFQLLQEIRDLWTVIQNNTNHNSSKEAEANYTSFAMRKSMAELLFTEQNSSLSMQEEIVQIPTLFSLMPHLSSITSLNPAFRVATKQKQSSRIRFVFGLPTVKRLVESYLIATLRNLIKNLSSIEQKQSLFVVFIAENDPEFFQKTASDIIRNFEKQIDSGLIEIISPPSDYYPDFSNLKKTLGDPIERVHWRTKQNLDFAYLMMYCRSKGTYYVQLEDDIISKPSYLAKMEKFIANNALKKRNWLLLDFCSLGFIGKLFRTIDLSHFVLFFTMFHNDKPVDWLLDNYAQTKVCRFDKDMKDCKRRKESIWITHKPSLFQHIGTHSSLKGKIQRLRDKGFGKVKLFEPHLDNPPVSEYYCTIKPYQQYKLASAYEGKTFFWGVSPKKGDVFGFKYQPPIELESCLINSGNIEHPLDILYNATLQIKPHVHNNTFKNIDKDGFINLASFDPAKGSIDIQIPKKLNPIVELRVRIDEDSINWVIVNEIRLI